MPINGTRESPLTQLNLTTCTVSALHVQVENFPVAAPLTNPLGEFENSVQRLGLILEP